MRTIALLVLLLGLNGCDEKTIVGPTSLDREFTLAPGATVVVSDAALEVRFIGVTEDSRCPADAVCIRAGDGVVQIEATGANSGRARYELHTEDAARARITHGAVTITLVQLAPYPSTATMPIAPNDYRATLRVTK